MVGGNDLAGSLEYKAAAATRLPINALIGFYVDHQIQCSLLKVSERVALRIRRRQYRQRQESGDARAASQMKPRSHLTPHK